VKTQIKFVTHVYVEVDHDTRTVTAVRVDDDDLVDTGSILNDEGDTVLDADRLAKAREIAEHHREWPSWQFGFDS
jgi:hypothetical protein